MNIKEKLAAAEAHLAVNRGEQNRHPEHLALDLLHDAVTSLATVVLSKSAPAKKPATAKAKRASK